MKILHIHIFGIIFFYTCQAFAIPAKNMESYRMQLPHVNEDTRQLITESTILHYDGLQIKDENGRLHKTARIGMVGRSIEIKNEDELYFITSYFRDKDYTVRVLAILAVTTLLEKNKLTNNLKWSYSIFIDTKDKDFLNYIETVISLIPKITIFDK